MLRFLSAALPLPLLYAVLSPVAALLSSFFYRRLLVTENLRKAFPQRDAKKRALIRRSFYRHLGDLVCESLSARTMSFEEIQQRVEIQGLDVLDACTAEYRQTIYLGCHMANWELPALALALARPQLDISAMYRPLHARAWDRFFKETRMRTGARMVPDNISPREIIRSAGSAPGLTMIFAEQRPWRKGSKHWARLLDRDTPFHIGIEKLPRLLNSPVIFAASRRVGRGRFVLHLEKLAQPPYPRGGSGVLVQYVTALERAIQAQPACWQWSMNLWKYPRPPHEALLPGALPSPNREAH